MRTPAQDAEATTLLREFDRTVARLLELEITAGHLRDRVFSADAGSARRRELSSPAETTENTERE